MFTGQGTYTCADVKYVGEFWEDKFDGVKGTYTWADGKYVGEFKNGMFHGFGKKTKADGTVIHDGMWYYGKPVNSPLLLLLG